MRYCFNSEFEREINWCWGWWNTARVHEGDVHSKCRGCGEEIPCREVYFWFYFHETCAKLPLEVNLFFHPCPVFLHYPYATFSCNSCFRTRPHIFTYHCEQCDFDLCVECATQALSFSAVCSEGEDERILHCCHRHPLRPLSFAPTRSLLLLLLLCRLCNMHCSDGPTWGCEPCSFRLHKRCLDLLPEIIQTNVGNQLGSWVLTTSPSEKCIFCRQTIESNFVFHRVNDGVLSCVRCCLWLRLVDEFPSNVIERNIRHFFHPCGLELVFSPLSTCNACFLDNHHLFYHCNRCKFFLDFGCSQLPKAIISLEEEEEEGNQVQHFCHWHPLKLLKDSNPLCSLCESSRSEQESFYGCVDSCPFYVHRSCMDSLPQETVHPLFDLSVVLLPLPSPFVCTTCSRRCSGLAYYCSELDYKFCVKCVVWPAEDTAGGRFMSILHWHQMSLCRTRTSDRASCFLCKEPCIDWGWSYKCDECDFFFHRSCAELPAKLDHPIHPQHRLTITNRSSCCPDAAMTCKLCLKSLSDNFPLYDWVYRCHECDFALDTQCASSLPSVEYKGHPHLLYVVISMHGNTECRACRESCKASSCTLRCAECDNFSLHLLCGPLPRSIKHPYHVHPLALQDYYVEDNESGLFGCHVCEDERDPLLRVYCCLQGCLMTCDVKCVISEVLLLLRGDNGEVELTTPFPRVACRVIPSKSVLQEMKLISAIEGPSDGNQKIKLLFSVDELFDLASVERGSEDGRLRTESKEEAETSSASRASSSTSNSLDKEVESYSFSFEVLSHFMKRLRSPSAFEVERDLMRKLYDGSVTTGAYDLPEILAPTYEKFFGTYNIVDDKCKLGYPRKRFLIFITCYVLHQMRITKVLHVTKETILRWLGYIRYVEEEGGFNVGIVAENMERVWRAHYYITSKNIVDGTSSRLRTGINQETRTIAELESKLAEAKAKLGELQLREDNHEAYKVKGSRGPMKKVRNDALDIKWRTCYESLITYPGNLPRQADCNQL